MKIIYSNFSTIENILVWSWCICRIRGITVILAILRATYYRGRKSLLFWRIISTRAFWIIFMKSIITQGYIKPLIIVPCILVWSFVRCSRSVIFFVLVFIHCRWRKVIFRWQSGKWWLFWWCFGWATNIIISF